MISRTPVTLYTSMLYKQTEDATDALLQYLIYQQNI